MEGPILTPSTVAASDATSCNTRAARVLQLGVMTERRSLTDYDAVLLDAYGVLVGSRGALPGAAEAVAMLRREGIEHYIVTNDASRLPETVAARLQSFGIDVDADRVLTSGSLIAPYFAAENMAGARCMVLGTDDSRTYVKRAGGVVAPIAADGSYDAIVVADDAGYPFLESMDAALSALIRHFDRGDDVRLVLPNPDLIYPKGDGDFGFTAGSVALLLEAALARRYPSRAPRFVGLGKPHAPIFDEAKRRAGSDRLLMIGDQLETDIAGALAAGIDAALITSGVARWHEAGDGAPQPTYVLDALPSSATIASAK